jgi:hypothetical protein
MHTKPRRVTVRPFHPARPTSRIRAARTSALIAAIALAAALAAVPALADWLVTEDGARVETKGPWQVEGRRVVFTLPNGTLSALRLTEVDLEASEQATADALKPPVEEIVEEKPKREPVLVLTNADLPKALPEAAVNGEQGETPAPGGTGLEGQGGLQVVEWTTQKKDQGIEMIGRIENRGQTMMSGIRLFVQLKDEDGEVVMSRPAVLQRPSLEPNGLSNFRVPFPEMPELIGTPHFELTSTNFSVRSPVPRDETEGGR